MKNEYTTIIVKPGEDLKHRARETREKFVGKTRASVVPLWGLGLFWALSAFSQTTLASVPLAPPVTFTVPANGATGVAINAKIAVTFSEAMNPATITRGTFALKQNAPNGQARQQVIGAVSFTGVTATLTPVANLAPNTTYTATVRRAVTSLAGDALASNFGDLYSRLPKWTETMEWITQPALRPESKMEWVIYDYLDGAALVGQVIQTNPKLEVFYSYLFPSPWRQGKLRGPSELGRWESLVQAKAAVEAAYARKTGDR